MPRSPSPSTRDREHHSSSRHREDDRDRSSRRHHHSSSSRRRDEDDADRKSSRRHRDDYDDDKEVGSSSHRRHRDRRDDSPDRSSRRDRDRYEDDRRHRKRSYDDDESERKRDKKDKKSRRRDETSQERRERKAAKKAAAALDGLDADDLAAQRANAADMLMYSAGDNPFNDANLGQQFKWGKKDEKDKKMGLTPDEARRKDEDRRRAAQEEIAKLNAARAQREADQLLREEEESKMARLAESAAMSSWVAKEDEFHLEQSRRRAAIRIRENRAKPIDLLAMNLRWADPERLNPDNKKRMDEEEEDDEAGLEIDLEEPYEIFDALTLEETEELYQDIQMYLTLETNDQNLDFWRSMTIVCDEKLGELRERAEQEVKADGGKRSRVDPVVKAQFNDMLSSKTYPQLVTLQEQVREKLRSDEAIDVEYWEQLEKSLFVWRAKAKLRDLHEMVLENRLEYLRRKQRDEAARQQEELVAQLGDEGLVEDEEDVVDAEADEAGARQALSEMDEVWDDSMEPAAINQSRMTYDERHLPVKDWPTFRSELVALRRKVLGASFVPRARGQAGPQPGENVDAAEALFAQEAAKGVDVSEEVFNGPANEAALPSSSTQTYDWEDKYRPRKPRYFNRVHTGFEWNKYNQTHYDSDNPPPKVVQGYKFNIFYPDLIDKSKAPSFKIIKEPGNDDTVIIKFEAGAPYEDLAFRIVNRPWQMSHKRGFRSSFERGILQLYFNFQRNFYRK